MRNFLKLTRYTAIDLVHHKSFYVVLTLCILFVLLLKGCYQQSYTVNGRQVDAATVAWHASIIAFQIIAAGALLIAALLSLGSLSRDRSDGSILYILSKPVTRLQYALAKIAGQWIVAFLFMFILHCLVLLIAFKNTGATIPDYILSSLVCSLNVLFMTVLVTLLSLLLPEFATVCIGFGIIAVSFVSDFMYQASNNIFFNSVFPQTADHVSLWRILRILWPKVAAVQNWAVTFINGSDIHAMGPLHPAINLALWTIVLGSLLVWRFRREDL